MTPDTLDTPEPNFAKLLIEAGVDPRMLQDVILSEMAGLTMRAAAETTRDQRTILPDLYTTHNPDIVVNAVGQTMLFVDKPLPETIWWAEYDHDLAQLYFVMTSGALLPLGIPVHPAVGRHMQHGDRIYLVQIDAEGKVIESSERVLMVRQYEDNKEMEKV